MNVWEYIGCGLLITVFGGAFIYLLYQIAALLKNNNDKADEKFKLLFKEIGEFKTILIKLTDSNKTQIRDCTKTHNQLNNIIESHDKYIKDHNDRIIILETNNNKKQ